MRLKVSLFAAAAALVLPVYAQAATITSTYSFTADNFHSEHLPSTPPPISSIAGTFTITFDPTVATTGVATFNITTGSLPNSGDIQFSFDPSSTGFLLLGDTLNGLNSVDETTNDFSFAIDNFSSGSPIAKIIYGNSSGDNYDSSSVSVAATPIPAALPLLATGILGLVGFGVYSSRRAAKPNAEAVPA
jgi:hypothetical protein